MLKLKMLRVRNRKELWSDPGNEFWTNHNSLHYAAVDGQLEMIPFLVRKGMDINAPNYCGDSPLILAVQAGKDDIVFRLLVWEAHVNFRGYRGRTPLMFAKTVKIAETLLLAGAQINSRDDNDWDALSAAVLRKNLPLIELLVLWGADLHRIHRDGSNALWWACRSGATVIVSYLLALGCDSQVSSRGKSCLEIAELWEYSKIVSLLKKGRAPVLRAG